MAQKKLTRSSNKVLAGVLSGIAEYFDVDVALVRVCYVALTIFAAGFPGLLLYILMVLIIPEKGPQDPRDPKEKFEEAEVVK